MDATTRLRAAREAAKQLQEDLAEASGVPQGTISRIENGTAPQVVTALRLARALGTTVEDLFSDLLAADDEERAKRAAPVATATLDAPTIDPPPVIEPGPDPHAAAKAKLAVEDAKRTETIVKAMLARKAESEAAEAAKRRVA